MIKLPALNIRKLKSYADWQLLLFLVLFLNVKLAVKIPALILIYILQFNFKFGFRLKSSRLPLFYLLIIGIAIFNVLVFGNFFSIKYNLVFFTGLGFWLMCLLAIHQIKLSVERNNIETLHHTLFVFFLLNVLFSMANLACIIWEIKSLNPYLYAGMYQKYYISTGDFIKGITFDVSVTNSVLNALGVIYFLFRKNGIMLLACMAILLLTSSNTLNIIIAGLLIIIFIGYSNRYQKSMIVICFALLSVFMTKVSPQNSNYTLNISKKILHEDTSIKQPTYNNTIPITQIPDNLLSYDERREKIAHHYLDSQYYTKVYVTKQIKPADTVTSKKLLIPQHNIYNTPTYQEATNTTDIQHKLLAYINTHKTDLPLSGNAATTEDLPGKIIALKQTILFLWQHPQKMLTGDGIGNFSSKIAFKATNFGLTGSYPAKYVYISRDFMTNHLDVYLNFFSKKFGFHSVINSPNAVYFQLLGEYGLMGLIAFLIYYIGYFLKSNYKLSYGVPVLGLLLIVFFLEYWFEQLSIVVFVELMLLINIKETEALNRPANAY